MFKMFENNKLSHISKQNSSNILHRLFLKHQKWYKGNTKPFIWDLARPLFEIIMLRRYYWTPPSALPNNIFKYGLALGQ